jgi:hypothetical protein
MLRRQHSSRHDRLARSSLEAAVRLGIVGHLPVRRLNVRFGPGQTIESHLAGVLGQKVVVGVMLGPPRANAKPVLRVLDAQGSTVAFAKISANDLTRGLLRQEASALTQLQTRPFVRLRHPRLLHHGAWQSEELLVIEALPVGRPNPTEPPPLPAMTELSRAFGTSRRTLGSLMGAAAAWGPRSEAARRSLGASPEMTIEVGCWHGDWSPWNMSAQDPQVLVWDWERFGSDVPLGFDALHFVLQQWVPHADTGHALGTRLRETLPSILQPFGVPGDRQAAVAALYLQNVLSRYRRDGGENPTPALRRRTALLSEALDSITSVGDAA